MSEEVDRSVPNWPRYRENGITPAGFRIEESNQPCFCTAYNRCSIYLPHEITEHHPTAKMVFNRIMPTIAKICPACVDRTVEIEINGERWKLFLYFVFSHILIRRLE